MKTKTLLNNVDASVDITSDAVQLDKRAIWKLVIDVAGTDGNPKLYIEEAYTGGGCLPAPSDYYNRPNKCEGLNFFLLDDSPIIIEKKYASSFNYLRVRLEANGATTGTVNVLLTYKTFP